MQESNELAALRQRRAQLLLEIEQAVQAGQTLEGLNAAVLKNDMAILRLEAEVDLLRKTPELPEGGVN